MASLSFEYAPFSPKNALRTSSIVAGASTGTSVGATVGASVGIGVGVAVGAIVSVALGVLGGVGVFLTFPSLLSQPTSATTASPLNAAIPPKTTFLLDILSAIAANSTLYRSFLSTPLS